MEPISRSPGKRYLAFPLILLALALALAAHRASAAQGTDRTALVAGMREVALTYADRLQDFICTQVTTRSADRSGSGKHWKRLEVQELELSYVAHTENYVLLKVNGESRDPEKRIKPGYARNEGEFGTVLRLIFDPKVNAEFTWDHEENRLCVFRYQVSRATSTWIMTADSDKLTPAHHGFVQADCDSGSVMRIQMESEPASVTRRGQHVVLGAHLDVRYGPAMIGGKEFLLPQSALDITRFGNTLTRAEIQFKDYRKSQVDAKILSDQEEGKTPATPKPQK